MVLAVCIIRYLLSRGFIQYVYENFSTALKGWGFLDFIRRRSAKRRRNIGENSVFADLSWDFLCFLDFGFGGYHKFPKN